MVLFVACFRFQFRFRLHLKHVQIISTSVQVADWSPFGKELPIRLTIRSLYNMSMYFIGIFYVGFKDMIMALFLLTFT